MSFLVVCDVDVPPVPPATCPVESIIYVQNFWDSGLTLEQTSTLIGAVVLLWATAYVFTRVKSML